MQEFYDVLKSRRSVRRYLDKEIEPEKVDRLLEILQRSQSAANCQPWHFILLEKGSERENFDQTILKECFRTAPLIVVACAEPEKAWTRRYDGANYSIVDVTIAVTEMISAATAERLGSCWIAAFDPVKLKETLQIPPQINPVGIITLGYAEEELTSVKKQRKTLREIIHHGKW